MDGAENSCYNTKEEYRSAGRAGSMPMLTWENEKLLLDGKEFYLASGDMHYFRYLPGGWRRRLKLMKAFGLTAVQTYVPWNLHEPERGEFHFEGRLDLAAFLRLCQEEGLYVMLRPAPYICSECDWGGLPYWLMKENACIRTMDEGYIRAYKAYFDRLCREFVPYLSTRGGPILAVALENEYGSFGMDLDYLRYCEKIHRENGIDVPLYTAGGPDLYKQVFGGFPHIWSAVDLLSGVPEAIRSVGRFQQGFPPYVAEMWGGRAQQWGGRFPRQSPEDVARHYREALDCGAYVNFYMFCGGTNFGFFSGALHETFRADPPGARQRYIPFATSYDVDAPVDEMGQPTRKYFLCREVLAAHRGMKVSDLPPVPENAPVQLPGEIAWKEQRRLFSPPVLEALTEKRLHAGNVRPMEELDQAYGWILYTTRILRTDPDTAFQLILEGVQDRADIYVDGQYRGTYYRDRPYTPLEFTITGESAKLDILVENMGRIGYGYAMLTEHKGLTGHARLNVRYPDGHLMKNRAFIMGWDMRSLPMRQERLDAAFRAQDDGDSAVGPRLFRGEFSAVPGVDAVLNFRAEGKSGMTRGFVCVNGFNLGRYWAIGPQDTLYIPGDLLREKNTIEIFELYAQKAWPAPAFCEEIALDSLKENVECLME